MWEAPVVLIRAGSTWYLSANCSANCSAAVAVGSAEACRKPPSTTIRRSSSDLLRPMRTQIGTNKQMQILARVTLQYLIISGDLGVHFNRYHFEGLVRGVLTLIRLRMYESFDLDKWSVSYDLMLPVKMIPPDPSTQHKLGVKMLI